MALFNLTNVSEALQDVSDDNSGISFAGLAKKWETEEDGELGKNVESSLLFLTGMRFYLQSRTSSKPSTNVRSCATLTLRETLSVVKPQNTSARLSRDIQSSSEPCGRTCSPVE